MRQRQLLIIGGVILAFLLFSRRGVAASVNGAPATGDGGGGGLPADLFTAQPFPFSQAAPLPTARVERPFMPDVRISPIERVPVPIYRPPAPALVPVAAPVPPTVIAYTPIPGTYDREPEAAFVGASTHPYVSARDPEVF